MQRRFFIEEPISLGPVNITGPDAHHIANVNRMTVGDELTLFDGSGGEFVATIDSTAKKSVSLTVTARLAVCRESVIELILAVALPKGDRQKILIEKLVELGVASVIPLTCSRSVAQLKSKSMLRLSRWVIEASKQCGRNTLMEIQPPLRFDDLIAASSEAATTAATRLIAHPYGDAKPLAAFTFPQTEQDQRPTVIVAVGPEGGFSNDEITAARDAQWQSIQLGRSILRVETAAAAVAAVIGLGNIA